MIVHHLLLELWVLVDVAEAILSVPYIVDLGRVALHVGRLRCVAASVVKSVHTGIGSTLNASCGSSDSASSALLDILLGPWDLLHNVSRDRLICIHVKCVDIIINVQILPLVFDTTCLLLGFRLVVALSGEVACFTGLARQHSLLSLIVLGCGVHLAALHCRLDLLVHRVRSHLLLLA